jgi:hypothetical protein
MDAKSDDPGLRLMRETLGRTDEGVDWPAFGARLRNGLAVTRPRRARGDVLGAAVNLIAAAVLLAAAGVLCVSLLDRAPGKVSPGASGAAVTVADGPKPHAEPAGPVREEPLSVEALLARLPAAVPEMAWAGNGGSGGRPY